MNVGWRLCDSYASLLALPRLADSATIRGAARFRSKGRLPVLSWLDKRTEAALLRSSQPSVGLLGQRSREDEQLLELAFLDEGLLPFYPPNSRL
jgi:hypothetical protein